MAMAMAYPVNLAMAYKTGLCLTCDCLTTDSATCWQCGSGGLVFAWPKQGYRGMLLSELLEP